MLFPEEELLASPNPLVDDAVARLNWGRHHISRFMRSVHLYLRTEGQQPHSEDEAIFIRAQTFEDGGPLPPYASLTFADAIGSLRSALDLALFSIVKAHQPDWPDRRIVMTQRNLLRLSC